VVLSTFFEDPKKIAGVAIQRIDFLGGAVVLQESTDGQGEQ